MPQIRRDIIVQKFTHVEKKTGQHFNVKTLEFLDFFIVLSSLQLYIVVSKCIRNNLNSQFHVSVYLSASCIQRL
jgi:hypothetical protein